jgi:hypothetical protein
MLCHWSLGTAALNDCAAASELSASFPASTMANHASVEVWASFSGVGWAWTRTEADSRRLIKSGDANFVGFAPL